MYGFWIFHLAIIGLLTHLTKIKCDQFNLKRNICFFKVMKLQTLQKKNRKQKEYEIFNQNFVYGKYEERKDLVDIFTIA